MILLHFTWCLPQTLVGLVLTLIFGGSMKFRDARVCFLACERWGVSLGRYIIIWECSSLETLWHEYGHYRQSLMLGPLYLPIVGLPSLVMNLMSRCNADFASRYYQRWPENWADRLGGVKR
jgi:hypothetical protein